MRQNIEVEQIRSAEDEDSLWVSFGFKSDLSESDVLFIVCGKEVDEQDRELGMDGLYFERFDQINSCYNAAQAISISEKAVDIDLTGEGSRELKVAELIHFDCRLVVSDFRDARKIFRKMAEHEWAKAIQSA